MGPLESSVYFDMCERTWSNCRPFEGIIGFMKDRPLDQRLDDEASLEGYRSEEARREAIYGFFVSKISIAEIARQFSCSSAEVQSAIDQARGARPRIERRENCVTWELHYAVVQKLTEEPTDIIKRALTQANIMKARQKDTISRGWMERWEQLLSGDLEVLKTVMLDTTHEAEDLRQMSPFIGAISESERLLAIKKATFQPGPEA